MHLPKINRKVMLVLGVIVMIALIFIFFISRQQETKGNIPEEKVTFNYEENESVETIDTAEGEEKYATSHISNSEVKSDSQTKDVQEPDVNALYPVKISDIYAQEGKEVEFVSFYPDTVEYVWEIYDMQQNKWLPADPQDVSLKRDELNREVSVFTTVADMAKDETVIRCTTKCEEGEVQKDMASLYILPDKIKNLMIDDTEITKCGYISALEIPVQVIYENEKSETITGLYGLKFLCSSKETEYEESVSGNLVEKRIETITECDYTYLKSGVNEKILRYMDLRENEQGVRITGCDKEPPVIEEVILGEYTISKENKTVPVRVEIYAEDNDTPYPHLKYAFAHEDTDKKDLVFSTKNEWNVDIDKNGRWVAYVADESGNIAETYQDIVVVDEIPPVITVSLKEISWCRENEIFISGKDGTDLSYQLLKENQCIYDWTEEEVFPVAENGVYTVKARDEAGNETVQEIIVENIDTQAPVITTIKEGV